MSWSCDLAQHKLTKPGEGLQYRLYTQEDYVGYLFGSITSIRYPFLDALASFKTMLDIHSVIKIFKISSITDNRVLQSVTKCYRMLQSVTECFRVSESIK